MSPEVLVQESGENMKGCIVKERDVPKKSFILRTETVENQTE